jgi:hypothetical protein
MSGWRYDWRGVGFKTSAYDEDGAISLDRRAGGL